MEASSPQPLLRLKQTKDLLLLPPPPLTPLASAEAPLAKLGKKVLSSTTNARPFTGMPTTNNACVMWIHLQASICTEWEHSSMVVKSPPPRVSSVREVSNPRIPDFTLYRTAEIKSYSI